MQEKIILIDAMALIFRAHYAFIKNPRINSKGQNTSAVFGFINSLNDILQNEKPTHIAVAFESPSGKTFRHDIFDNYKGQREATPQDVKIAIPYIKKLLKAMNIPVLEQDNYEADDIIATLAQKYGKENTNVFIFSPDKDFYQLITDNIFILKPPKKTDTDRQLWDKDRFFAEFGIKDTTQMADILALMGDAVDNIKGATGIGSKTAQKLVAEYGTIENIFENIDKLSEKHQKILLQDKEQVIKAKRLILLHTQVPIDIEKSILQIRQYDGEKLLELFKELEFTTIAQKFLKNAESKATKTEQNLFSASDQNDLFSSNNKAQVVENNIDEVINKIKQKNCFAFYLEHNDENLHNATINNVFIACEVEKSYKLEANKENLRKLKEIFENKNICKVSYNIKQAVVLLQYQEINLQENLFDIMIAHYLISPDSTHKIEIIAQNYIPNLENNIYQNINHLLQIKDILKSKLEEINCYELFKDVEMPLSYVLAKMEINGISLDSSFLNNYSKEIASKIDVLQQEIFSISNTNFNIDSPKQLGDVLFEIIKIDDKPKKTKTKQYATDEQTLLKLKSKSLIIAKILHYRSLKKLLSTYTNALPLLVNKRTNRIHTTFNQAVANTGRLSSNHPNLQNIPIKDDEGREIRKAFVPSQDNILISADYSQIELRIIAHLSEDETMLKAFNEEEDIHKITASKIFNVDIQEVTRDMRMKAKVVNFGIIYGMSAFGLSEKLEISRTEAKTFIEEYFAKYPKIKQYIEQTIVNAKQNGAVKTILSRIKPLPDLNSANATVRAFAERNAVNAPVQGSAADIIKIAMLNVQKHFTENNLQSKLILQVHDELLIDTAKNEIEQVKQIIKQEMEHAVILKVPLKVEIGQGKNWFEAH